MSAAAGARVQEAGGRAAGHRLGHAQHRGLEAGAQAGQRRHGAGPHPPLRQEGVQADRLRGHGAAAAAGGALLQDGAGPRLEPDPGGVPRHPAHRPVHGHLLPGDTILLYLNLDCTATINHLLSIRVSSPRSTHHPSCDLPRCVPRLAAVLSPPETLSTSATGPPWRTACSCPPGAAWSTPPCRHSAAGSGQ